MAASLVMISSLAELLAGSPAADDHQTTEANAPKAPLPPMSPNKRQKVDEFKRYAPVGDHSDMVEIACNAANQLLHYLACDWNLRAKLLLFAVYSIPARRCHCGARGSSHLVPTRA